MRPHSALKPMLAKPVELSTIAGPVLVQPKIDGIRAVFDPETQQFTTRNGNVIASCAHLVAALHARGLHTETLDGEIYCHDLPFDVINGLVRRKAASADTLQLQYHVFDRIHPTHTNAERADWLHGLSDCERIKIVPTYRAVADKVDYYYQLFIVAGFEGIMIRDPKARYQAGRSNALGKFKPVQDLEAELVGFAESDSAQHRDTFGALILRLANGKTFQCAGISESERQKLWQTRPIGQPITVKYQELSPDGIPRFPRFKAIRHDI